MFITPDVDIPEALLKAQEEGKLVVFVGAGVSVDAPSGLPLFPDLAEKIALDSGLMVIDSKVHRLIQRDPDQFLGQLAAEGTPVNDHVKDIISSPSSFPNQLHRSLVRLFRFPEQLRIVTTNYDGHLINASEEKFGNGVVDIYRAPALPMGNDFAGIVHLHGSVDQEARHLVVTSNDFGRAYLTDAWAARFLYEMFRTYTVLFVGYSHSDRVMDYLARGLPADSRARYALVCFGGQSTNWSDLGIEQIIYPRRSRNRHIALVEAINAWAKWVDSDLLRHDALLRQILNSPPSLDRSQTDYIRHALLDQDLVKLVIKYLTGAWVEWLIQQPEVIELFQTGPVQTTTIQFLSGWLANHLVHESPETGIETLARIGSQLSNEMWLSIAHILQLDRPINPEIRSTWIGILLTNADGVENADMSLAYVTSKCSWADDSHSILAVVDYLLTPKLSLSPPNYSGLVGSLQPRGRYHATQQLLQKFVVSNLDICASDLMPIVIHHLWSIHSALYQQGRASRDWDPMSFHRSAIEPHSQDAFPKSIDNLIDCARDVMVALAKSHPDTIDVCLEYLASAEAPLLRRLAIHVWTVREDVSSDEKLKWVLGKGWLFDIATKHEVYQLLLATFPSSSPEQQEQLLDAVRAGPTPPRETSNSQSYAIFNLANWLVDAGPPNGAQKILDEISALYPHFRREEHLDLDHWVGVPNRGVGTRHLIAMEDLLAFTPKQVIDWLAEIGESSQPGIFPLDGSRDVEYALSEAANKSPEWALKLLNHLNSTESWSHKSWNPIIAGIAKTLPDVDLLMRFLEIIQANEDLTTFRDQLAILLEKPSGEGSNENLLAGIRSLCQRLWELPESDTTSALLSQQNNWLTLAVNHWAGRLCMAWLRQLSAARAIGGDSWSGFNEENVSMLNSMIKGSETRHDLARAVVASQLHFLNLIDRDWTRKELLPLFDWTRNATYARQAWEGYLVWGQVDESLVEALLPHYLGGLSGLPERDGRDLLCDHLALIALRSPTATPKPCGWLDQFVRKAEESARSDWAQAIGKYLEQGVTSEADEAWDLWLGSYWERRLKGKPLPITADEGTEMLKWVLNFSDHLDDAVDLMVKTPLNILYAYSLGNMLQQRNVDQFPRQVANLLIHALENTEVSNFCQQISFGEIFETLRDSGEVSLEDLTSLCAIAMRLGYPDANSWLS